jgi:hypothetical protein
MVYFVSLSLFLSLCLWLLMVVYFACFCASHVESAW